jgi:histidinol dehydrogenase
MLDAAVVARTREILERVRGEGDAALVDLTRALDDVKVENGIAVPAEELEAAAGTVPTELRDAIDAMAERVRRTHELQLPTSWDEDATGPASAR